MHGSDWTTPDTPRTPSMNQVAALDEVREKRSRIISSLYPLQQCSTDSSHAPSAPFITPSFLNAQNAVSSLHICTVSFRDISPAYSPNAALDPRYILPPDSLTLAAIAANNTEIFRRADLDYSLVLLAADRCHQDSGAWVRARRDTKNASSGIKSKFLNAYGLVGMPR